MSPRARLAASALALGAALLAQAACTHCFRDPNQLVAFRVLGVRAEPSLLTDGQPLALTVATADVRERPVAVEWHACPQRLTHVFDSPDAGPSASFDDCLRAPAFARGASVTVAAPPPPSFPAHDGLPAELDLVGFACAGGTITASPDPSTDATPRCTGDGAQGVVFSRALLYQPANIAAIANPEITEVRFGPAGATTPLAPDAAPSVPHCDGRACARYRFEVAVTAPMIPVGDGGTAAVPVTVSYVVDLATLDPDAGPALDGIPPVQCPGLPPVDEHDDFDWTPPSQSGTAHLYFLARAPTGGFAWTERRVVVQ